LPFIIPTYAFIILYQTIRFTRIYNNIVASRSCIIYIILYSYKGTRLSSCQRHGHVLFVLDKWTTLKAACKSETRRLAAGLMYESIQLPYTAHTHTHTHIYTHIYILYRCRMYIVYAMCVCVCVYLYSPKSSWRLCYLAKDVIW
jgi:hypothetical protein